MPAYDTRPAPGRTIVGATIAAKALRKDIRTIRAMITNGTLQGVCEQAASRRRWYVYADQLEHDTPARDTPAVDVAEQARLSEENAHLRARLANAEEVNRSLLGSKAVLLDALRSYQAGAEQAAASQAALEEVLSLQRSATTSFQSSSNQLAEAFSELRDALATFTTPDDPRDLTSGRLPPSTGSDASRP